MRRLRRFWVGIRLTIRRIIFSGSSPRSIAAAVALGTFIAFLPLYGLQMIVSAVLATLFKVNRPAAVLMAWISNPATIPFFLWAQYLVGNFILHFEFKIKPATEARFQQVADTLSEFEWSHFSDSVGRVFNGFLGLGGAVLGPTLLGAFVTGFLAAVTIYPLTYWVIRHYRSLRRRRSLSKLVSAGYLTSKGDVEGTPARAEEKSETGGDESGT